MRITPFVSFPQRHDPLFWKNFSPEAKRQVGPEVDQSGTQSPEHPAVIHLRRVWLEIPAAEALGSEAWDPYFFD